MASSGDRGEPCGRPRPPIPACSNERAMRSVVGPSVIDRASRRRSRSCEMASKQRSMSASTTKHPAGAAQRLHPPHRLLDRAAGTIGEACVLEFLVEQRTERLLHRRLRHAVDDAGNGERPRPAAALGDRHRADRPGTVGAGAQCLAQTGQFPRRQQAEALHRHAVAAGRAIVAVHPRPGGEQGLVRRRGGEYGLVGDEGRARRHRRAFGRNGPWKNSIIMNELARLCLC